MTGNYLWLTRELFQIHWEGATCILTLGTERNSAGTVRIKWHRGRIPKQPPCSIWIKRLAHGWRIAFSYDDGHLTEETTATDHLEHLKLFDDEELEAMITPVDRGVAKPLHTHNAVYTQTGKEKQKVEQRARRIARYQRQMARQQKGSNRRKKTLERLSRLHAKTANVRENFWHQTTRALVDNSSVVVIENLKLSNMTRRPKARYCDETGRWLKNGARAKAGLNKSILNVSLGLFETLLTYKMVRACKPLFKVAPNYTSQECACCGYTHPGNRRSQADFHCQSCGNSDNADHNAALVIRKRAITLIKDSGTELVGAHRNVLQPRTCRNSRKTKPVNAVSAMNGVSKKKRKAALAA